MASSMSLQSWENVVKQYCSRAEQEQQQPYQPEVIFLPPQEHRNINVRLGKLLSPKIAETWLMYTTSSSLHEEEILSPILDLIREMLFIDEDLVDQNASLPEEERLLQVGPYLIPDFLHNIPKIQELYRLMANLVSEDEQQKMVHSSHPPRRTFFSPKPSSPQLYETILMVFRRIIYDLFGLEGLILILQDFSFEDRYTCEWLRYAATHTFSDELPLCIIILAESEYQKSAYQEQLSLWLSDARVDYTRLFDEKLPSSLQNPNPIQEQQFNVLSDDQQHQPSKVATSSSELCGNDSLNKFVEGSQSLYHHLKSLGYIHDN